MKSQHKDSQTRSVQINIWDRIRVLITPSVWLQNYPYSEAWDKKLRQLLAGHRFGNFTEHKATLGGCTVWLANHPYASMTLHNGGPSLRPSRALVLKAYDILQDDLVSETEDAP